MNPDRPQLAAREQMDAMLDRMRPARDEHDRILAEIHEGRAALARHLEAERHRARVEREVTTRIRGRARAIVLAREPSQQE